jgi:hypothetical protein
MKFYVLLQSQDLISRSETTLPQEQSFLMHLNYIYFQICSPFNLALKFVEGTGLSVAKQQQCLPLNLIFMGPRIVSV